MEIIRNYVHKTFGAIGSVTLIVPNEGWVLQTSDSERVELPLSSVEHLANFALQTLQDAYAGADNANEASANWSKKLLKLINGTVGAGGSPVDPMVYEMRVQLRRALRKQQPTVWKKLKEMDAKEAGEALDKNLAAIEKNKPETFAKMKKAAEAEIARKAKEAAENAKLDVGEIEL